MSDKEQLMHDLAIICTILSLLTDGGVDIASVHAELDKAKERVSDYFKE